MKKIAIIATHPVQYNAPFFKLLSESSKIQLKVFYTWGSTVLPSKFDPGFSKDIEWDIPLLEGYEYEFLENTARKKGSHHYGGIVNPGIIDAINEWQPDALLVYGWKFHSHLKAIRHFSRKIPVWFRGDSTLLDEKGGVKSFAKKLLLRWVYRHVDKAFYTGKHNRDYFLHYGLREKQLVYAPPAVANERFSNWDERYCTAADDLKKELHIPPRSLVFLFAGKLQAKKGVGTLLQAFKTLHGQEHVHLVVAGNGPQENELKEMAAGRPRIHFLDFRNQEKMPVLYQLADVFVLPSDGPGESWGLAINEAMAAGKPVMASSKCGGAADLVSNGENGFIFTAGDSRDLSVKMQQAISDVNELAEMGRRSKAAIGNFTFNHFVKAIERAANVNE